MKIKSVGLNFNGAKGLRPFLSDSGFSVKYFYDYTGIPKGAYSEDLAGIQNYLDTIDDQFDAILDLPVNFVFEYAHSKNPDTKFICIQRDVDSFISLWQATNDKYYNQEHYVFEEAYCKMYLPTTGKIKISDLDETDLRSIYAAHYAKVDEFFAGKPNFLKVQIDDPEISAKLRTFFEIASEVQFDVLADQATLA
jgi:hypothetical protein